jgi:hypothetical protein
MARRSVDVPSSASAWLIKACFEAAYKEPDHPGSCLDFFHLATPDIQEQSDPARLRFLDRGRASARVARHRWPGGSLPL